MWICSNKNETGMWHLGVAVEGRGAVTGKLFSVSYKTACSGRQLGGAWSYSKSQSKPMDPTFTFCRRCEALAARDSQAVAGAT